MMDLRTIVTFSSARFAPPQAGLVSPADPMVQWMAAELRRASDFHVLEPEGVEWGAFVRVEHERAEYQINFALGGSPLSGWMIEVRNPPLQLRRVLAIQEPAVHRRLVQVLHSILHADSTITDVQWHLGHAIGKGDLSTAAATPD